MEKLDQILASYVPVGDDTRAKVLGASFIVVKRNEILYEGSAGRIGLKSDSPPFSSQSSGWIASMTKVVTAAALMHLVQKDLVQLDEDITPLIPELSNARILHGFKDDQAILEDNADPITLRQLLSHSSGMSYDMLDPDLQKWSSSIGRTDSALHQTREGWNTPLKFRPGTSWLYGTGIDWAGLVLEKLTGQSLGTYLSEEMFKPLHMDYTTFDGQETTKRRDGHVLELSCRSPDGTLSISPLPVPETPSVCSGGSGLFSTARDYAAFLQEILAAGEGQGAIFRQDMIDEMFRPQLNDAQCQVMQTLLRGNAPFPDITPLNHGISGAINMEDVHGKRHKGALTWGGMSSPQWWIDRNAGIAAVLFVNIMAQGDDVVPKLYDELERAVYETLRT